MFRKQYHLFKVAQLIVLGVLVPVTLLFLDANNVVDFRAFFMQSYQYIFKATHERMAASRDLTTELVTVLSAKRAQETHIAELEKQLIRQQLIVDNLIASQVENLRLTQLLELKNQLTFETSFARVLSYDPQNHFTTLIINKGSTDEFKLNKPILAYQSNRIGLVGFILQSRENFAEIRTILDQRTQLSVKLAIHDSLAVARGQSLASILLEINFIDIRLEDVLYQDIYTSGLGQRYPANILVGSIVDVEQAKYGLFQKAYMKPAIDFYALKEVFVITSPGELPSTFSATQQAASKAMLSGVGASTNY